MTEKPQPHASAAPTGFASAAVLGFIAYAMMPILALITAVMGLVLVVRENVPAGIAFLAMMQVFVVVGIVVHVKRRRLVERHG